MARLNKGFARDGQVGLIVILILLLVVAGAAWYFFGPDGFSKNIGYSVSDGRVVFAVTDAAANMQGVEEVRITVKEVRAHSESSGWVTLTNQEKVYNLMELQTQGKLEVLADSNLSVGGYDQVRFDVTEVVVVDQEGEHEAKLPSNELKFMTDFTVLSNTTATATFDFILSESLHTTGNGKYIFAPVVQVETRNNAEAEVMSDGRLIVRGGAVADRTKSGMDAEGNFGVGLKIPANVNLTIGLGDKINVGSVISAGVRISDNNSAGSGGNMGLGLGSGSGY